MVLEVPAFEKQLVLEGSQPHSLATDFPGLDSQSIRRLGQFSAQCNHLSIDR